MGGAGEGKRARIGVDLLTAALIGLGFAAVLMATTADYAMVWDEGHTVRRERVLAGWFERLTAGESWGGRTGLFSHQELERSWPFSREEPDGHPPFYALLGLLGWWATHDRFAGLTPYRVGPIVLTSFTTACLWFGLARREGRLAALGAVACLMTMPRVFSHAHYAHYDMPMTCFWILAQMLFIESLRHRGWAIGFGLAVGLGAGTKFTGWFAPIAPLLWTLVFEGRRLGRRLLNLPPRPDDADRVAGTTSLLIGFLVACVVLLAIQPAWWIDPIEGVRRFLVSNLTRSETKPVPTMYLGAFYPFALPWHNTLVLTGATVPVTTLVLGLIGLISVCRGARRRPERLVWVLSWATLMVVRALPNAPGHDGIRLILPSIVGLTVLAGLGASALAGVVRQHRLGGVLGYALVGLAAGEGLLGIGQLYPMTLSYYNVAVGGLKGAERLGLELTYYWDSLDAEFTAWANREAKSSAEGLELRFPVTYVNVPYLKEWEGLPAGTRVIGFDSVRRPHYVLQRRQGVYYPYDWWLEREGKPEFTVSRQGVDLLRVYDFEESFRAYSATKDVPIPKHLDNER